MVCVVRMTKFQKEIEIYQYVMGSDMEQKSDEKGTVFALF